MKIRTVEDKKFYEELINVILNYNKIKRNPNRKIENSISFYKISLIVSIILLILIFFNFKFFDNNILIVLKCMLVVIIIFSLILCIKVNKMLNDYLSDHSDSELIIDKDGIELNKKNINSVKIKWDSLEYILVLKYGFLFISNNNSNIIIDIPIEYLNDVKKELKKLNKNIKVIND